jgi:hypothetical protein
MKQRLVIAAATVILTSAAVWLLWPRPTVGGVMSDFYREDAGRAEDMLMDHGSADSARGLGQAPRHRGVASPAMPKRRYAIGFLGVAGITEALPVLRRILGDESEADYFRADALESIYRIEQREGLALAAQYRSRDDFLGFIAGGLINGSHKPSTRSLLQAATGHHE